VKTKYFNVDDALHKAVNVFWSHGYEASSMQTLQDEMGIRRQSLYDTFGNKRDLFLASLDYYHANVIIPNFSLILNASSPKKGIKTYFNQRIKDVDNPKVIPGCLVTNSLSELGLSDELVIKRTKRTLEYMENVFYQALIKAKELGEVSADKEPKLIALQLLNNAQGLFVISKSGMSQKRLKLLVNNFLIILD
jgi:TetR/AcrR family transcriptional repressor of nem operon